MAMVDVVRMPVLSKMGWYFGCLGMWDAHLRLKMTLFTVLYTATIIGVVILYSIESQRMPRLDADLRPGDAWCTSEQRHFHS